MSFTLVTVSGDFTDLYGLGCNGKVVFTLNNSMSQQGFTTYPQDIQNTAIVTNGAFSVVLPSTEDLQTQPQGVTYTASIQITDSEGNIIEPYSVTFQLPAANSFDFRTVTPALSSPSYTYLSTNGGVLNGNLTLDVNSQLILNNALLTEGDLTLTPGKFQIGKMTPISQVSARYPGASQLIPMAANRQVHLVSPIGFDTQIYFSGGVTVGTVSYGCISVYDSALGSLIDYSIPNANSYFQGITVANDGLVYSIEVGGTGLWSLNPYTGDYINYPWPAGFSGGGDRIILGPDGNLYQSVTPQGGTENSNYLIFDTTTHAYLPPINYTYEFEGHNLGGANQTLCCGDDGLLWYTVYYFAPQYIVGIAPGTCEVVSVQIASSMVPGTTGTFQFAVDGGDRNIYVPYNNNGSGQTYITKQNKDTGVITQYPLPGVTNTYPLGIVLGSDGFIYCADVNNARVFRLDRVTGNVIQIDTAASGFNSLGLNGDGNLYFGGTGTGAPVQALLYNTDQSITVTSTTTLPLVGDINVSINCTANSTITLPPAYPGKKIELMNISSSGVVVTLGGVNLIGDLTTSTQYAGTTAWSDGTNWYVKNWS